MTSSTEPAGTLLPKRYRRSRLQRLWRNARAQIGVYGLGAAVFAGALWLTYQFVEPAPPGQLKLATGDPAGAYHRFGLSLQAAFAAEDITLELVPSQGSIDNLASLEDGSVDAAFLQSGIASGDINSDIEGLASLYYEPVWLFSRANTSIKRLNELIGLRVATGTDGSGTRAVAQHLLTDSGLGNEVTSIALASSNAANALLEGDIDAAFFITSEESSAIERLLESSDIELANLDRAEAHARRNRWLINLTVPRGVLNLQTNQPPSNIQLLAVAATLATRSDLHPALAELLLQTAAEVARKDTLFSSASRFPSPDYVDFPISTVAERYYERGIPFLQRYLPFWAANLLDRLKLLALPFLALLIPLSRVLPPAYKWTVRKKVYRWYDDVMDIDLSARKTSNPEHIRSCLTALEALESEVCSVEVPLSYANELFMLRQHIDLVKQRLVTSISTIA